MKVFESKNHNKPHEQRDLPTLKTSYANQSMGATNMLKRDRFELLSAYLDGEVTAAERRQVEGWLATDLQTQRLYARLLKLRQGLRTMPVPSEGQPVEQTVQQVFSRLNRRPKMAVVWGGAATAALFVGALSGVLPTSQSLQMAKSPAPPAAAPAENLMVALNTPVVEIPKAAVAAPEKAIQQTEFPQQIKDNVH